ncbi:hypothetical protein Ahy_A02g006033 isoform B [Arachis hypogaea]|uniref:Uncharacterized protein n=1 Tax=Arachis hypogaea TaxID=3818 RepID=A0A445E8M8_ARAHY|nr:hypothetical protein Ahy_A02g006033 isoform B [Arachis hypogaea]
MVMAHFTGLGKGPSPKTLLVKLERVLTFKEPAAEGKLSSRCCDKIAGGGCPFSTRLMFLKRILFNDDINISEY